MQYFKSNNQNKQDQSPTYAEDEFPFQKVPNILQKNSKGLFGLFSTKKQEPVEQPKQSFMERISDKIQNKTQQMEDNYQSYTYFTIFLLIGAFFISFSFVYLPLIVLLPHKFVSFFTLGSIMIMISLAMLKGKDCILGYKILIGPINLIRSLFTRDKILFTVCYICTLVGALYYALITPSYLLVLFFGVTQVFSLMYLVSSTVPGGITAMNFISKNAWTLIKKIFSSIMPKKPNKSYLPI